MCFEKCLKKLYKDEYAFGATVLRYAFGILFLLVAVKKLRMGIPEFAQGLMAGESLVAQEIPDVLLLAYGYVLPLAELAAGVMLLLNKYTKEAYALIALIYLTFVFGQMYNGNTVKVGMEYFPSLIALAMLVVFEKKSKNL
jgi:uncharacterized membrane protein YphA (DoxX/SURF4 family)